MILSTLRSLPLNNVSINLVLKYKVKRVLNYVILCENKRAYLLFVLLFYYSME